MQSKKKQIVFFLICILFILGGLFTGVYWMTHVDQLKKNSTEKASTYPITLEHNPQGRSAL